MNKIETEEIDFIPSTLAFVKQLFKHCVRNITNPEREDLSNYKWKDLGERYRKEKIREWLFEQQNWCLSKEGEFWFHTWEEITTMSWEKLRSAFLRLIDRELIENE